MLVGAPVRLVTDRASLLKDRLVQMGFLELLCLIGVARQADVDRVCLG